ncbi:MAG: hypothetical protein WBP58_16735 [Chitinophagaceae bacterium]
MLLTLVVVLTMLNQLGQTIAIREIIALFMVTTCLVMPYIGYEFYSRSNSLALLWVRFMPIDAERYFSYAFPAVTGYVMALCLPFASTSVPDKGKALFEVISKAKAQLKNNQRIGIILLLAGVLITTVVAFIPVSIRFFFNLFYFSSFAGLLYLFFADPFPLRRVLMLAFVSFIVFSALRQGMFTIVVYMGMTLFPFLMTGVKIRLWKKLVVFFSGVFLVLLLQSVKPMYRLAVWEKKYEGNKLELFAQLAGEKLTTPSTMFDTNSFFFIYYRMNQGFNMALVMKHVPAKRDYDEGKNLFVSIASTFVPRFLWSDKPEAGGHANMKYYTGYTIKGWATNVGPLGEAYGSFGPVGGIIYMILLGLFIRFYFGKVLALANRIPLLLFWIPVLFYQVSYSAENDTLQILNSLFKTSLFIFLLYKFFPVILTPGKARKKLPSHLVQRPNVGVAS